MAKKQKKTEDQQPTNVNEIMKARLAELGIGSLVKFAEDYSDMDVECVSTGLPQLDVVLHPVKKGLPCGRDIEVFSRDPEVGKTSLGLEIVKAFQQAKKSSFIADAEHTITEDYCNQLGIVTDPEEDPTVYATLWHRHEERTHSVEDFLNTLKIMSQEVDVCLVDSVAALDLEANIKKDADDNNQVGGISKKLSEFTKKNTFKKATVVWINQTRQKVGGYNPTGQIQYVTTGGRSLGFFASIRLELSLIDRIKDSNENVLGYKIKVFCKKNKIAAPEKSCVLTYIFGDGFTPIWDYMQLAMASGIILKKKGWFVIDESVINTLRDTRIAQLDRAQFDESAWKKALKQLDAELPAANIQGELNLYYYLKNTPDLYAVVQAMVDGTPENEEVQEPQTEEPQAA